MKGIMVASEWAYCMSFRIHELSDSAILLKCFGFVGVAEFVELFEELAKTRGSLEGVRLLGDVRDCQTDLSFGKNREIVAT